MKHNDTYLREKLSDKLSNHETPVPNAVWQNISSKNTVIKSTWSLSKMIAAASLAAAVVAASVYFGIRVSQSETKSQTESVEVRPEKQLEQAAPTIVPNDKEKTPIQPIEHDFVTTEHSIPFGPGVAHPIEAGEPVITCSGPPEPMEKSDDGAVNENTNDNSITPTVDTRVNFSCIPSDKTGMAFFFIPETTSAKSYRWDFGDGETSTEMSPNHQFETSGDYEVKLVVEDASGQKEMSKPISAWQQAVVEAPTIFTPNNDGKNDVFEVASLSKYATIRRVMVFNSEGAVVFEGDSEHPWDGNDAQGIALPAGNYFYDIQAADLRQRPVEKRGSVYLKR